MDVESTREGEGKGREEREEGERGERNVMPSAERPWLLNTPLIGVIGDVKSLSI